jgi:hypothetical protein
MEGAMRIFILDEIVVKPGLLDTYRDAWRARYRPAAEQRGMMLEGAWQSPAGMDYDDRAVTLYYLWSVEDVKAWWAMRLSRTADGRDERFDKLAWWQESKTMTLARKRSTLTRQPESE